VIKIDHNTGIVGEEIKPENKRYDTIARIIGPYKRATAITIYDEQLLVSVSGTPNDKFKNIVETKFKKVCEILLLTKPLLLPQRHGLSLEEMIEEMTGSTTNDDHKAELKAKISEFFEHHIIDDGIKSLAFKPKWNQLEKNFKDSGQQLRKNLLNATTKLLAELETEVNGNNNDQELVPKLKEVQKKAGEGNTAFLTIAVIEALKNKLHIDEYNYLLHKIDVHFQKDIDAAKELGKRDFKKLIQSYNTHAKSGHKFDDFLDHAINQELITFIDLLEKKENSEVYKSIHAEIKLSAYIAERHHTEQSGIKSEYYIGVSELNCKDCHELLKNISTNINFAVKFFCRGQQSTTYASYDCPEIFKNLINTLLREGSPKGNRLGATNEDSPLEGHEEQHDRSASLDISIACRNLNLNGPVKRSLMTLSCKKALTEVEKNGKEISLIMKKTYKAEKVMWKFLAIEEILEAQIPNLSKIATKKAIKINIITQENGRVTAKIHGKSIDKIINISKGKLQKHIDAMQHKALGLYGKLQLIQGIDHLAKMYKRGNVNGDVIEGTVETTYFTLDTIAKSINLGNNINKGLASLSNGAKHAGFPSAARGMSELRKAMTATSETLSKAAPFIAAGFGAYNAARAFQEGEIALGAADTISTLAWLTPYGPAVGLLEEFLYPVLTKEGRHELGNATIAMMEREPETSRDLINCTEHSAFMCVIILMQVESRVMIQEFLTTIKTDFEVAGKFILKETLQLLSLLLHKNNNRDHEHIHPNSVMPLSQTGGMLKGFDACNKENVIVLTLHNAGIAICKKDLIRTYDFGEVFLFDDKAPLYATINTINGTLIIPKSINSRAVLYFSTTINPDPSDISHYLEYQDLFFHTNAEAIKTVTVYNLASGAFADINPNALNDKELKIKWACVSTLQPGGDWFKVILSNNIKVIVKDDKKTEEFMRINCDLVLLSGKLGFEGFIDVLKNKVNLKASLGSVNETTREITKNMAKYVQVLEFDGIILIEQLIFHIFEDMFYIRTINTAKALLRMSCTEIDSITVKFGNLYTSFAIDCETDVERKAAKFKWTFHPTAEDSHSNLYIFKERQPKEILTSENGGRYDSEKFGRDFITTPEQLQPAHFFSVGSHDDVYILSNLNRILHNTIKDQGGFNDFFIGHDSKITEIELDQQQQNIPYGNVIVIDALYREMNIKQMENITVISTKTTLSACLEQHIDVTDVSTCPRYFQEHHSNSSLFYVVIKDRYANHANAITPLFTVHDKEGRVYDQATETWNYNSVCSPESDQSCEGSEINDTILGFGSKVVNGGGGINFLEGKKIMVVQADCGINVINFTDQGNELHLCTKYPNKISVRKNEEDLYIMMPGMDECNSLTKILKGFQLDNSNRNYKISLHCYEASKFSQSAVDEMLDDAIDMTNWTTLSFVPLLDS